MRGKTFTIWVKKYNNNLKYLVLRYGARWPVEIKVTDSEDAKRKIAKWASGKDRIEDNPKRASIWKKIDTIAFDEGEFQTP